MNGTRHRTETRWNRIGKPGAHRTTFMQRNVWQKKERHFLTLHEEIRLGRIAQIVRGQKMNRNYPSGLSYRQS